MIAEPQLPDASAYPLYHLRPEFVSCLPLLPSLGQPLLFTTSLSNPPSMVSPLMERCYQSTAVGVLTTHDMGGLSSVGLHVGVPLLHYSNMREWGGWESWFSGQCAGIPVRVLEFDSWVEVSLSHSLFITFV